MSDEMRFERRGRLAIATLNRPAALNAMTLGMYRAFDAALTDSERDEEVRAVLVRGAGDRAFCAGGDVRAVFDEPEKALSFFREEYRFIERLSRYPKPVVALADGLTLGGGMGIAVHCSHCVATERSSFGMPEIFIGFVPDVGATEFLGKAPGKLGLYLGLTGARAGPADAVHCGLARAFVPAAAVARFVEALASDHVEAALAQAATDPGPSSLLELRPRIDRVFGLPSAGAIRAELDASSEPWAREASAAMARASPTSLEVIFRQLSRPLDLPQALALEFRLVQHLLREGDFREGVRAMLVDKDKKPRWRPVADAARFFATEGTEPL